MDIIKLTGTDFAALSALDLNLCCGCMHLRSGYLDQAEQHSRELVRTLSRFNPKTVVVACPHTYWWMRDFVSLIEPYDFELRHQVQFIADQLGELHFQPMDNCTVAYHDSCGFGRFAAREYEAPRKILRAMPGVKYVEMPRNREKALCCGGGGPLQLHLESVNSRLQEAKSCGADTLTSVCAGCVMALQKATKKYNLQAVNIVSFAAEGLGIHNEDLLQQFTGMNSMENIVKASRPNWERSAYTEDKVRRLIQKYLLSSRSLGTHLESSN
jgi:heterodisulfide reductase subunit D